MSYPWKTGEVLLAADLNAAIANASGFGPAGGDLSGLYPNPTVTRINGVTPAPSATMDTTNAANISTGTLPAARLPNTAVTPGSYTNTSLTVDATGRITSASSGTGGAGGFLPLGGGTLTGDLALYAPESTPRQIAFTMDDGYPLAWSITNNKDSNLVISRLDTGTEDVTPVLTLPKNGFYVDLVGYLRLTNAMSMVGQLFMAAHPSPAPGVVGASAPTINMANDEAFLPSDPRPAAIITGGRAHQSWQIELGDATADTGGNAGQNFVVRRYSDAGSPIDAPISINRATGVVTFSQPLAYAALPTEVQQVPITFTFSGKPGASAQVFVPIAMAMTVPSSLAGTKVFDNTQTTANAQFALDKINAGGGVTATALGLITVTGTNHTSCTLTGSGGSLAAGDTLRLTAPSSQDTTLADVSITVMAMRV